MVKKKQKKQFPVLVTVPDLPPIEEFKSILDEIWKSKVLTNNGPYVQRFEKELAGYLGVKHVSVFSNGTLALMTALRALDIVGEVITTPFSFVATTHSVLLNGLVPVFADINPKTYNLDPEKVEAAITPETKAILPVHVYGTPCEVDRFAKLAKKYNLKIIYDAAHAFGVTINRQSVLNFGDMSVLSFHATKVFNTLEGGAVICKDAKTKKRLDNLKNFGITNEISVTEPALNGKMNEMQAALGLLQLKYIDKNLEKRHYIANSYLKNLLDIAGITCLINSPNVKPCNGYFPILINESAFGISRDRVYEELKTLNIFTRKYFYPLISSFSPYNTYPSATNKNLPVASNVAKEILCLPIYPDLEEDAIVLISNYFQSHGKE